MSDAGLSFETATRRTPDFVLRERGALALAAAMREMTAERLERRVVAREGDAAIAAVDDDSAVEVIARRWLCYDV